LGREPLSKAATAGFQAQGSDAPAVLGKETMGVASPGLEQGVCPLLSRMGTQLTIPSLP